MWKRHCWLAALAAVLGMSAQAGERDRVVAGGAVGGAVGALIGHQVDGRDGALVGAVIGSATGVALASEHPRQSSAPRAVAHTTRRTPEREWHYREPVRVIHHEWVPHTGYRSWNPEPPRHEWRHRHWRHGRGYPAYRPFPPHHHRHHHHDHD